MRLIENKDLPIIITPNKTNNIQMMIQNNKLDNNNNLCDLSNKNSNKKNKDTMSTNSATFYVDENCIKFVEDFGYKREFIMKSLEGNEINHATACYYLKMSLLNE